LFNFRVKEDRIKNFIENLKDNKACGFDKVCNEFFKYGNCVNLIRILKSLFECMISCGFIPKDFNIAILKPIPKKGELRGPKDYRPISISTVLSSLLEHILLENMPVINESNPKQFGYKKNTSCKSAYFLLNETIQFYKRGKSNLHLISLDASKAFDKLWRAGLFFKLIDVIEPPIWRILFLFYSNSKLTISFNGRLSKVFDAQEGVKQGGIISPYLFNYFLNDLLNQNDSLNVGAKIGSVNVSMIAYCDDLILISPTETHMKMLINLCESYAAEWKIEFNALKSIAYSNGTNCKPLFSLNSSEIPHKDSFIYLGLPVGEDNFVMNYFEEKMSKVEKSFYSLRGLGCKPSDSNPKTIAFLFKQFCQ
jgi:hypothetical protein